MIKSKEHLETYTNAKLKERYRNAKKDFGIEGHGTAVYDEEDDLMRFTYTENGVTKEYIVWYILGENISYAFNVWAENAE